MPLSRRERDRLADNLVDELNGAALYDSLAVAEKDTRLAEVYRRLAAVERRHAERWRCKLEESGETLPSFRPSWRTRTLGWLARKFGTSIVLPSVQNLEKGSAWEAAITSFILFALGAVVPVVPFLFARGDTAVWLSVVFSGAALFLVGGAITLFTGRSVLFSGSRQVLFGLIAAALTFGIGRLVGVSLG